MFPPLVQVPHISPLEVLLYCGKWTHSWLSKHCRKKCFFPFLPLSPTISQWWHSQNLYHLYFCIRTNTLTVSYPYSQITTTNQYYLVLCLVVTGSFLSIPNWLFGIWILWECGERSRSPRFLGASSLTLSWELIYFQPHWHIPGVNTLDTGYLYPSFFKSPVLFKLV